jgi:hypothetical protein
MSISFADAAQNPYASPSLEASSAPVETAPSPTPGSLAIIFPGFVLLLVGYFMSNLLLIGDLYHIGMGPQGQVVASPLAAICRTAPEQWLLYVLCAAAFVAGAVMIGSQRFNPMAVVCYVMCPIVGAIYLVGSPLRMAVKYAEIVATLYLLVGSCLAFTGLTQLLRLHQQSNNGFAPIAASMMTEAGLALVVGAALKYWALPKQSSSPAPALAASGFDEMVASS